jgi:hypothetical protein
MNWAVRLSVGSALTVCLVVMCLFIGDFATFNMGTIIVILFIAAMALIISALLLLLLEVSIATQKLLKGVDHLLPDSISSK